MHKQFHMILSVERCYTTLFYFISSLIGESCVHFGSIPLSGLTNVPLSYLVHASTIRTPFISYLLVDFISFGADSGEIEPRYTHIFSLCLPLSRLVATRYVESSVIHTWLPYTEGSHWTVHIDLWTLHSGQSQLLFLSPISRHHFFFHASRSAYFLSPIHHVLPWVFLCLLWHHWHVVTALHRSTPCTIMSVSMPTMASLTCSHCTTSFSTMYYHECFYAYYGITDM